MIDLKPEHLEEVKRILAEHAPDCEVRVFGSRVNGQARKHSDLDLVLVGKEKLDWRLVEKIKDAFADSNLPFMVDIIDWAATEESFRCIIRGEYVVVQEGKQEKTGRWGMADEWKGRNLALITNGASLQVNEINGLQ